MGKGVIILTDKAVMQWETEIRFVLSAEKNETAIYWLTAL